MFSFLAFASDDGHVNVASITISYETQSRIVVATANYVEPRYCPNGVCDALKYATYIYFQECPVDTTLYRYVLKAMNKKLNAVDSTEIDIDKNLLKL